MSPVSANRQGRTELHQLVKSMFKFFQTETVDGGNGIVVNYRTRFRKKRQRRPKTIAESPIQGTSAEQSDTIDEHQQIPALYRHRHWRMVLRKTFVEHNAAMKALAASAGGGAHANDFSTAGMKDRVAVTVRGCASL